MPRSLRIGNKLVGDQQPVYVIAEIGINHNGDLDIARRLVAAAAAAGCDAVKFQKRTPEICVPRSQWEVVRDTPWGPMTYLQYRHQVEFDLEQYKQLDACCREHGIDWLASCWDCPSVSLIAQLDPPAFKIASATLTDDELLRHTAATGKPIILSTGMSSLEQIDHAVAVLGVENLIVLHATSTYPCEHRELNLSCIETLRRRYGAPVGYSGHERGLATTVAAVALGACVIERHITLDRTMWGSDQAASVEPQGFSRLVRDIRAVEEALGDGVKRVYDSEVPSREKLRRVDSQSDVAPSRKAA